MNKLISVIIPLYNKEKYIKRCLLSVLNQSYNNYEIIVVNDGSTDKSEQIVKTLNDKKIRIFTTENKGVSHARNYGIKKAMGEYICFVDSDDYVSSEYLSSMIHNMSKDIDLVVVNKIDVYNGDSKKNDISEYQGNIDNLPGDFYEYGFCHPVWGKLYRKDIIIDYHISFKNISLSEDSFFNLKYLESMTNKVKLVNNFEYYYVHYNLDNLTSKSDFKYLNIYNDLYNHYEKYFSTKDKDYTLKIMYSQYYNLILKLVCNNNIYCLRTNKLLLKTCNHLNKNVFPYVESFGNEKIIKFCIGRKYWFLLKILLYIKNLKECKFS